MLLGGHFYIAANTVVPHDPVAQTYDCCFEFGKHPVSLCFIEYCKLKILSSLILLQCM